MPFVLTLIIAGSVTMQRFESEAACVAAKKAITVEMFTQGSSRPMTALCLAADTAPQAPAPAPAKQ